MKTAEERIRLLHKRADQLRKKRDQRILTFTGTASAFLLVLLCAVLAQGNRLSQDISGNQFAAASMLSENTGGYVLVAIIAFTAAVIITVSCIKWKKRNQTGQDGSAGTDPDDKEKQ